MNIQNNKQLILFNLGLIFVFFLFCSPASATVLEQSVKNIDVSVINQTSSLSVDGLELILRAGDFKTSSSVTLTALDEPVTPPTGAKLVSKMFQVDFSSAPKADYVVSLKNLNTSSSLKRIFFYDKTLATWRELPSTVNYTAQTVSTRLAFPFVRLAIFEFPRILSSGEASWYSYKGGLFAASPDYPMGTKLLVTSLNDASKNVIVTVNDYGPNRIIHPQRVIDLDKVAFAAIADVGDGITRVRIEPVNSISLELVAPIIISTPVVITTPTQVIDISSDLSKKIVTANNPAFDANSGELWQNNKTGGVYFVTSAGKQALTDRIYLSTFFKNKKIISKTPTALEVPKLLEPLRFGNGSLLMTSSSKAVYLIYNNQRKAFLSGITFEQLGYAWADVITVPSTLLNKYAEGSAIGHLVNQVIQINKAKIPTPVTEWLKPISSKSAIVLDASTGNVLYSKNSDEQLPIASLSKLVAMQVYLDTNPDFKQEVTYKVADENYNYQYANKNLIARLHVNDGETMLVRDLFYSALLGSANNAVESLVRLSGLTRPDFIAKMNYFAQNNGATHTKFIEPTGLSPENVSTASEFALLANKIFQDPTIVTVSQKKEFSFTTVNTKQYHYLKNSNSLIFTSDLNINGSKTGYLDEALYCLITRAQDVQGRSVLAITFGTPTRTASFSETKNLIYYGFSKLD